MQAQRCLTPQMFVHSVSPRSLPPPLCGTVWPATSWCQNPFLRNSFFVVDIKSTNPKEFKELLCIRPCVFSVSCQGKRAHCSCLLCLPHTDDEQGHRVRNPTPRSTLASASVSLPSFKSPVSTPVLPSCHAYFNYLTGLQRQGRERALNRCHFSSPPGGCEGTESGSG